METILYSYTATGSDDTWYAWLGLFVALTAFGATYYFLKKKDKGRKHTMNALVAMLFFILGLLGTSTAVFSAWSIHKIGQVNIFADHVAIGSTNIDYKSIRKIAFKEEKSVSLFNSLKEANSYYFLVIECNDRSAYVIPGQSYPIGEIKEHITELRIADAKR